MKHMILQAWMVTEEDTTGVPCSYCRDRFLEVNTWKQLGGLNGYFSWLSLRWRGQTHCFHSQGSQLTLLCSMEINIIFPIWQEQPCCCNSRAERDFRGHLASASSNCDLLQPQKWIHNSPKKPGETAPMFLVFSILFCKVMISTTWFKGTNEVWHLR